jgi:hypothetical protein
MRDEVLAEWLYDKDTPVLHVYCHVSGGLVFGSPGWRYDILKFHMPQVLQTFRYGDSELIDVYPEYDQALVFVHFRSNHIQYHRKEPWGLMADYQLQGKS